MENKQHILLLSSWYPTRIDETSGNFIKRFAQFLSGKFKISVIFVKADSSIEKVEFHEMREGDFHEIIAYYPKPKGIFSRTRQLARYKKVLDTALQKLDSKPDLIHAHVAYPKGKEFEYVSSKLGVDFILQEHSSDFSEHEDWSKIKRQLVIQTLRKARLVLPVSHLLEEEILKVEPHLARVVLPLPVNTELFFPEKSISSQRPYTFLHVSGLDEKYKNVRGIVEAFHRVYQHHPDTRLTIVTDGDPSALFQFLEENNWREGIDVKRNLTYEEVAIEYRNSDCFVLFSRFETFSCVLVEAMASGIQIITTEVGVVPSIDEKLLTVVPNGDIHALATSMEELCMGKRNVESVELVTAAQPFSNEYILERLSMIYNEVLLKNND
ncbi:glycosyltransferase [Wandonia haliotis]|uniref:Glycosyltransferase n=1 Tax=Wandonia haliotis TaxID=574963 RepID=A0ABN1MRW2_9FLAO